LFRSGFFTSDSWTINGDGFAIGNKAEGSDFFAKIVSVMVPDGVPYLPSSNLLISATTGMILGVGAGFAFKNGYLAWETTDTTITCTSSESEQTLYISARLDTASGEFTGGQVDAYTTFDGDTDICFAIVVIPASAVTITSAMITDVRGNATYCGYITDQREYLEDLIEEIQDQLSTVIGGGVPDHASTHATGEDDELLPADIGALPYDAVSSNLIINGNFSVNQRVVSNTVTLSAGAYGHDRWKAGASGCTYTFATSENVTTLTISAGSLIQVVEGLNLQSGMVCLSWTGTAQGKVGDGSYSASGVTGTATGGTNLNIEFNTGTLSKVQLNYGSVALPFVPMIFADELMLCQRYYEKTYSVNVAPGTDTTDGLFMTTVLSTGVTNGSRWLLGHHPKFLVPKRVAPTVALYIVTGTANQINVSATPRASIATLISTTGFTISNNTGGTVTPTAGEAYGHWTADAEL